MRLQSALVAVAALAAADAALHAQGASARGYLFREPVATVTVFGGFSQPGADSQIFDLTFTDLTASRRDFLAVEGGVDVAFRVGRRMDLVLGVSRSGARHPSELRDWVDQDELPILQTTSFRRTPLGAMLRYNLRDRGRSIGSYSWIPAPVVPWVGLGAGAMHYKFEQSGDFVDFETLDIFNDEFTAEGWAPFAQAAVGAGWTLLPSLQLTTELRYVHGRSAMSDPFAGFDKIDLSGLSTLLGITLRF